MRRGWIVRSVLVTALLVFPTICSAKTVFLGSSQTAGWKYMGAFQDVDNKAVVSNTTAKILKSLHPIVRLKPDKIFILEGVNELYSSNASILGRYREILHRLNQGSPKTLIFVQSVLPVVHRSDLSNKKIEELNAGLKALCAELPNCSYIDLYSHFAVNGELNEKLTTDGVHLRPDGYKLWQSLIEKYVTASNEELARPETVAGLSQPENKQ